MRIIALLFLVGCAEATHMGGLDGAGPSLDMAPAALDLTPPIPSLPPSPSPTPPPVGPPLPPGDPRAGDVTLTVSDNNSHAISPYIYGWHGTPAPTVGELPLGRLLHDRCT